MSPSETPLRNAMHFAGGLKVARDYTIYAGFINRPNKVITLLYQTKIPALKQIL